MGFEHSDVAVDVPRPATGRRTASTKIVVAGGFGVGKTTLVGTVSEIEPLRTEAIVTGESTHVDDLGHTPDKHTTTVAMDFGRITLSEDLVLYLFGTPGQKRFWFMWDDLVRGAIGAVVVVDTARLDEAFSAVDYFEASGIPFLIAVNDFDGQPRYSEAEVADALAVGDHIPIMHIDARDKASATAALIRITELALQRLAPESWEGTRA